MIFPLETIFMKFYEELTSIQESSIKEITVDNVNKDIIDIANKIVSTNTVKGSAGVDNYLKSYHERAVTAARQIPDISNIQTFFLFPKAAVISSRIPDNLNLVKEYNANWYYLNDNGISVRKSSYPAILKDSNTYISLNGGWIGHVFTLYGHNIDRKIKLQAGISLKQQLNWPDQSTYLFSSLKCRKEANRLFICTKNDDSSDSELLNIYCEDLLDGNAEDLLKIDYSTIDAKIYSGMSSWEKHNRDKSVRKAGYIIAYFCKEPIGWHLFKQVAPGSWKELFADQPNTDTDLVDDLLITEFKNLANETVEMFSLTDVSVPSFHTPSRTEIKDFLIDYTHSFNAKPETAPKLINSSGNIPTADEINNIVNLEVFFKSHAFHAPSLALYYSKKDKKTCQLIAYVLKKYYNNTAITGTSTTNKCLQYLANAVRQERIIYKNCSNMITHNETATNAGGDDDNRFEYLVATGIVSDADFVIK